MLDCSVHGDLEAAESVQHVVHQGL
jgi:hypothetical protein